MRMRGVVIGLSVFLGALTLVGCNRAAPSEEPLRAVKVVTVGEVAGVGSTDLAGEVRARIESRLGFRISGKLTERRVELGAHVRAGDVLARLDATDYRLGEQAAQAQFQAAQTNRDLAATELRRFQGLREQNFISAAELERREAAWRAAQAQWEQAKAQAQTQSNMATYAELRADTAGVVTSVDAEPGQVVSAGTPVVRLAYDGSRDVVFALPESLLDRVRVGQSVRTYPWGAGERTTVTALVREIAASADPITRTYAIKVGLPAQAGWPLGSTVAVRLDLGTGSASEQGWRLPSSAVRQEGGVSAVWVLDPTTMTVRSQPVELGGAQGADVLVRRGLQQGMQVVSAGTHVLSNGQRITRFEEFGPKTTVQSAGVATKNVAAPSAAH